ncbi:MULTISPECIES: hypothetical protein [Bacillaceae]|uniref:hypothetical protein n=1 Tax=Bacillaceae TaxID=186817 RepID=UPI001C5A2857|nr:hypothetical protein [Rossellomorea sp. YZS02]MBW3112595.1 hypothetical protein [Bacillus sp. MCCB 382]MDX8344595.1 hypothetical protein [Rossellomorea sp. YZS02]
MKKTRFILLYVVVIGSAIAGSILVEFSREQLEASSILLILLSLAFLSISLQLTVLMNTRAPLTKWKWLSLSSGLLVGGLTFLYLFLLT